MSLIMKYFVLRPSDKDPHGVASLAAMEAYAKAIEKHDPELAHDLKQWVKKVNGTLIRKAPKTPELYVKDLVRSDDVNTGDMYLRWKESVDLKNWERKTVIISALEIEEKDFSKIPQQVYNLLTK